MEHYALSEWLDAVAMPDLELIDSGRGIQGVKPVVDQADIRSRHQGLSGLEEQGVVDPEGKEFAKGLLV